MAIDFSQYTLSAPTPTSTDDETTPSKGIDFSKYTLGAPRSELSKTLKSTGAHILNSLAGQPVEDIGAAVGSQAVQDFGKGVRNYAEEVQKENPSSINSLGDIVKHPIDAVQTAVGNVLPQVPLSLGSARLGAMAGGAIGSAVPVIGTAAGALAGGALGLIAPSYLQEYTEMRGKQHETGQEDIPKALAYAAPAAAIEGVADKFLLGGTKLLPKGLQNAAADTLVEGASRLGHIGKQGLKGAALEGGQEYAQTGLEQLGGNQDINTEESANERNVSAALGAIGGGIMKGSLSGFDKREQTPTQPPPVVPPQVEPQPEPPMPAPANQWEIPHAISKSNPSSRSEVITTNAKEANLNEYLAATTTPENEAPTIAEQIANSPQALQEKQDAEAWRQKQYELQNAELNQTKNGIFSPSMPAPAAQVPPVAPVTPAAPVVEPQTPYPDNIQQDGITRPVRPDFTMDLAGKEVAPYQQPQAPAIKPNSPLNNALAVAGISTVPQPTQLQTQNSSTPLEDVSLLSEPPLLNAPLQKATGTVQAPDIAQPRFDKFGYPIRETATQEALAARDEFGQQYDQLAEQPYKRAPIDDERIPTFGGALQSMASDLQVNGGIVKMPDGKRTPSLNTQLEWFNGMRDALPNANLTPAGVQNAVNKAIEGKPLGKLESAIVTSMLDYVSEQQPQSQTPETLDDAIEQATTLEQEPELPRTPEDDLRDALDRIKPYVDEDAHYELAMDESLPIEQRTQFLNNYADNYEKQSNRPTTDSELQTQNATTTQSDNTANDVLSGNNRTDSNSNNPNTQQGVENANDTSMVSNGDAGINAASNASTSTNQAGQAQIQSPNQASQVELDEQGNSITNVPNTIEENATTNQDVKTQSDVTNQTVDNGNDEKSPVSSASEEQRAFKPTHKMPDGTEVKLETDESGDKSFVGKYPNNIWDYSDSVEEITNEKDTRPIEESKNADSQANTLIDESQTTPTSLPENQPTQQSELNTTTPASLGKLLNKNDKNYYTENGNEYVVSHTGVPFSDKDIAAKAIQAKKQNPDDYDIVPVTGGFAIAEKPQAQIGEKSQSAEDQEINDAQEFIKQLPENMQQFLAGNKEKALQSLKQAHASGDKVRLKDEMKSYKMAYGETPDLTIKSPDEIRQNYLDSDFEHLPLAKNVGTGEGDLRVINLPKTKGKPARYANIENDYVLSMDNGKFVDLPAMTREKALELSKTKTDKTGQKVNEFYDVVPRAYAEHMGYKPTADTLGLTSTEQSAETVQSNLSNLSNNSSSSENPNNLNTQESTNEKNSETEKNNDSGEITKRGDNAISKWDNAPLESDNTLQDSKTPNGEKTLSENDDFSEPTSVAPIRSSKNDARVEIRTNEANGAISENNGEFQNQSRADVFHGAVGNVKTAPSNNSEIPNSSQANFEQKAHEAATLDMKSSEAGIPVDDRKVLKSAILKKLNSKYKDSPKSVKSKNGDDILVAWNGIKHAMNAGLPTWQEAIAALHIENLIENADLFEVRPDKLGRKDPATTTLYQVEANFDGMPNTVTIFVKNHSDGNRYYDHVTIENSPVGLTESDKNNSSSPTLPYAGDDESIPNTNEKATDIYNRSNRSNEPESEQKSALVAKAGVTGRDIQNEKQKTDLPTFAENDDIKSLGFDEETLKNAEHLINNLADSAIKRKQAMLDEIALAEDLEKMAGDKNSGITIEDKPDGSKKYTMVIDGKPLSFTRYADEEVFDSQARKELDELKNRLVEIDGGEWSVAKYSLHVQPLDETSVDAMRDKATAKSQSIQSAEEKLKAAAEAHKTITFFDKVIEKLKSVFYALFNPKNKNHNDDDKRLYKWRNADNTVMFTMQKGQGKFKLLDDKQIKGNSTSKKAQNTKLKKQLIDEMEAVKRNAIKRGEIQAKSSGQNKAIEINNAVMDMLADNPVLQAMFDSKIADDFTNNFEGFTAAKGDDFMPPSEQSEPAPDKPQSPVEKTPEAEKAESQRNSAEKTGASFPQNEDTEKSTATGKENLPVDSKMENAEPTNSLEKQHHVGDYYKNALIADIEAELPKMQKRADKLALQGASQMSSSGNRSTSKAVASHGAGQLYGQIQDLKSYVEARKKAESNASEPAVLTQAKERADKIDNTLASKNKDSFHKIILDTPAEHRQAVADYILSKKRPAHFKTKLEKSIESANEIDRIKSHENLKTSDLPIRPEPESKDIKALADELDGKTYYEQLHDSLWQSGSGTRIEPQFRKENSDRLAPNGKPSNLNAMQYAQVRTPEFKAWFGDWENDAENASKAVDENGEPMVAYHGTKSDFSEFEPYTGFHGFGIYATTDKYEAAYSYAGGGNVDGGNVLPIFINLKNAAITKNGKDIPFDYENYNYDGVIYIHEEDDVIWYVTSNPNQIKSAIGNTGAFSSDNDDIRFSKTQNPNDFVKEPNGTEDFGEITPEIAKAIGRQSAKIKLRYGDEKAGLLHIEQRHEADIKAFGFDNVIDFIHEITKNFTEIYKSEKPNSRGLILVEKTGKMKFANIQLEMSDEGDFYEIKNSTPARSDHFKNKTPIWERNGPTTPSEKQTILLPDAKSVVESINQSKTNTTANAYTKESLSSELKRVADNEFGKGWFNRLLATGKFKIIDSNEADKILSSNSPDFKSVMDRGIRNTNNPRNMANALSFFKEGNGSINIPNNTEFWSGLVDSITNKGGSNAVLMNSKFIANILKRESFAIHGFSSLDVKTQDAMLQKMLASTKNAQVFNSIVGLIPVNVMNVLIDKQLTPDMLLHDKSMLLDALTRNGVFSGNISLMDSHDLASVIAFSGAVVSNFNLGRVFFDRFITGSAKAIDRHDNPENKKTDLKFNGEHTIKSNGIQAFYDPKTGTTFFIAENISSNTSLKGLLLHEISIHALKMGKDDAGFKSILKQLESMRGKNAAVDEAFAAAERAGTSKEDMLEESLGYFVEKHSAEKLAQRLLAWFRNAIREIGRNLPLLAQSRWFSWANSSTINDLHQMAREALRKAPDELIFDDPTDSEAIVKASAVSDIFKPIAEQAKRFKKELIDLMLSKKTLVEPITVSDTSFVLKAVGASELPIMISRDVIRKATNGIKHNVSMSVIESLPEMLANPAMILNSITESNSLIVLSDRKDESNRSVMIALRLSVKDGRAVINRISSVYGRNDEYFTNLVKHGHARYINMKKSHDWLRPIEDTMLQGGTSKKGSQANYITEKDLINSDSIKFSKRQPTSDFEIADETKFEKAQRLFQDDKNRWTKIQNAIKASGGKIDDSNDVYRALERMPHIAGEKISDFKESTLTPLFKRMEGIKSNLNDVALLLYANQAPARNQHLDSIDPALKKGVDFGMTNEQAARTLSELKAAYGERFSELQKIANDFWGITDKSINMMEMSGAIDSEQAADYRNSQMQKLLERLKSDKGTGLGFGASTNNTFSMRSIGRDSATGRILESIITDHERAILWNEKIAVGETIERLINDFPEFNLGEVGEIQRPVLRKKSEFRLFHEGKLLGVASKKAELNAMKKRFSAELGTKDGFRVQFLRGNFLNAEKAQFDERKEIRFKRDGKEVRIKINDELALRAYNALGDEHLDAVFRVAAGVNRVLRQAWTQKNPAFFFINPIRDIQQAAVVLTGEGGVKLAKSALKNWGGAWQTMAKFAFKKPVSEQWQPILERYRSSGGSVSTAYISNLEKAAEQLHHEFARFGGNEGVIDLIKRGKYADAASTAAFKLFNNSIMDAVENINVAFENATRLAAFKAAIDAGYSDYQAASLSANVTVNFTKRGELSGHLGAMYLFANANIQGTTNIFKTLLQSNHKNQAWGIVGSLVALGFMAAMMGGDDGEDDLISDYEQERNVSFDLGDGKRVTIPLAYGWSWFRDVGRAFAQVLNGGDADKISRKLASAFLGNFSPVGNPIPNGDFKADNALVAFAPTFAKPVAMPAVNKSAFGTPLMPESPFKENQPDSEKIYRKTRGTVYDEFAKGLNSATGGDSVRGGLIDVSPETLKNTVAYVVGGAGRFVTDAVSSGESLTPFSNEEFAFSKAPVFKAFIKSESVDDYRRRFYAQSDEAGKVAEQFSGYKQKGDRENMIALLKDNPKLVNINKSAISIKRQLKAIRDKEDTLRANDAPASELEGLENREIAILKRFDSMIGR